MPMYFYLDENGKDHKLVLSCMEKTELEDLYSEEYGENKNGSIIQDGKILHRNLIKELKGFKHCPGNWPQTSTALGVGASQIKDAEKESIALGVPTRFNKDGDAIFESRSHRKAYAEATGHFDRDAGYGDPTPSTPSEPKPKKEKVGTKK